MRVHESERFQIYLFRRGRARRGGAGVSAGTGFCIRRRVGPDGWRHYRLVLGERPHSPKGRGTIKWEFDVWDTDLKMRRTLALKRFVRLKVGFGGVADSADRNPES